ncbi:hypothetical protein D9758_012006 [Tetrapyrgos nigripes]|uniref:hAT-like transposase RNase-H fold domain-containing protein n=1 Tax=Tetrapyrgos nigripes TaxID=182062 RepID=A0A8H5FQ71_9AGAR|nr:hypothetical protein D9758_012006 [Tetrapyrgos nigripes]
MALCQQLLSDVIKGTISITCDAWQAGNGDAYFAVTGHWIEEKSGGEWKLEGALLGFTQMNSSHNGIALGCALFRILCRFKIVHKLGWITCDNASNNGTMLHTLGYLVNSHHSHRAHIINLATQALVSVHSKASHYNPQSPDSHEPDLNAMERDVLGLVRAIIVKVRSSAKRKQAFLNLQLWTNSKALQLLLDMVVRWSSMYTMLHWAEALKEFIKAFIYELSQEEKDLTKQHKIDALSLSEQEWIEVDTFIDLLAHANKAQQAFSSEHDPTLHTALPALEKLHSAWEKCMSKLKYCKFMQAMQAGADKLEGYYNKTSDSDVYVFSMVLDPNQKMAYIKANWSEEEYKKAIAFTEQIFKAHYEDINQIVSTDTLQRAKPTKSNSTLLHEVSDDEDDNEPMTQTYNENNTAGCPRRLSTTCEEVRLEKNPFCHVLRFLLNSS